MLKIAYALLALWSLGMFAMIARLWYFQIIMLNNLAPGRSPWERGGGFFDASRYNPVGQEAHRRMLRFYCKAAACGFGGLISIAMIGSLLHYISSPP